VEAARSQSQAPVSNAAGIDAQLSLDLADAFGDAAPSGLPEMSAAERVQAEVSVLGLDTSAHIIEFYAPMLSALGVVRSSGLLSCRSRQEILVAGVKVATQTPPIRSGHRVVFLTLDDGAGPVDATFFPDAQDPYAQVVFHSWLLLVRGVVRRTGPRGVSLRATGCWELSQVRGAWSAGGVAAVSELLAASPRPGEQRPVAEAGQPAPGRRVLLYASGFMKSPYADISPAGDDAADGRGISRGRATAKLWHSSSGSAGR
jgi:error-prone DNA polymerase